MGGLYITVGQRASGRKLGLATALKSVSGARTGRPRPMSSVAADGWSLGAHTRCTVYSYNAMPEGFLIQRGENV